MKRLLNILFVSGVLVFSGCQVKEDLSYGNGDTVIFGSSMNLDSPETKTAFTGPTTGGINWSGGEYIQIRSIPTGESTISGVGNYTVSQSGVNTSGIAYSSGTVFKWRKNQYTFYGFYPAALGNYFSYSNGAETISNMSVAYSQSSTVDMTKLYMFARKQESQGNTVQLDFYPLVTTVGITINNKRNESVTLTGIKITSTEKSPGGSYSVSFNGSSPLADNAAGWPSIAGGGMVSLTNDVTVASKSSETVYLFLVPQVYDASRITLTLQCGNEIYEKTLGTIFGVGSLQPAHKYHLGINIPNGGQIEVNDLTLGGAQLILATIYNQVYGNWHLIDYISEQANGDEEEEERLTEFWENIIMKTATFYHDRDNGQPTWRESANERFNPSSTVFTSDEDRFTSEELDAIKDMLRTVTSTGVVGQDEWKITADIEASDFGWLPNLESIDLLELDQNLDPRPSVTIDGLSNLNYVNLNQYTRVDIENCGNGDPVTITMNNANNASGYLVLKDMTISGQIDIGNQHMVGPVLVENVRGMHTLSLGNGTDTVIKDCPDLQTINATTAHNLTVLTVEDCESFTSFNVNAASSNFVGINLKNTPYFQRGVSGDGQNNMTITLQNCSTNVSSPTPYIQLNNTSLDNVTVSRDSASSHVVVQNNQGATK